MTASIPGTLVVAPPLASLLPPWVPAQMPFRLDAEAAHARQVPEGTPALTFEPADEAPARPIVLHSPSGRLIPLMNLSGLIDFIRMEKYRPPYRPLYTYLPFSPRLAPPFLRSFVHSLLSRSSRRDRVIPFPAWPNDFSVDSLQEIRASVEQRSPSPPPWPDGKRYAVVSTHDVDSDWIFRHPEDLDRILAIENRLNIRSAWYFVLNRLPANRNLLRELRDAGHEIGFHCTNHDHRFPFLPPDAMRLRMESALPFIREFDVKGMRSANYLKSRTFQRLQAEYFDYDLSYRDSYHGVGGSHGCSTVRPFLVEDTNLLEIPTTVPEDYALRAAGLGREAALAIQREAVRGIRSRGGGVNIVTHPEPELSLHADGLWLYEQLLTELAPDPTAWITRPRDLAAWCRSRQTA